MPTLPNTPSGVIRSHLHYSPGTGFNFRPRFDIAYTGSAPSQATLASVATAVRTAHTGHLAGQLCSAYQLDDTTCQDLATRSTPSGVDTTASAGSRGSGPPPNNCTAMIIFSPNRAYRGSKPKIFLPYGIASDQASVTGWSTGFANGLTSAWAAFIAALNGQTIGTVTLGAQAAVSYYGPPTIPNTGRGKNKTMSSLRSTPLVMVVSAAQASQTFGSQRRRLRVG